MASAASLGHGGVGSSRAVNGFNESSSSVDWLAREMLEMRLRDQVDHDDDKASDSEPEIVHGVGAEAGHVIRTTIGGLNGNEDDGLPSSRSSGEYRLAVIGNSDLSTLRPFVSEESMQQVSVSVGFPTIESITGIIENDPQLKRRRVTFAIDDHNDSDDPKDVQMREELHNLLDAQQSGTAFILGHSHVKAKQGSSFLRG